jgi:hypothetical protein
MSRGCCAFGSERRWIEPLAPCSSSAVVFRHRWEAGLGGEPPTHDIQDLFRVSTWDKTPLSVRALAEYQPGTETMRLLRFVPRSDDQRSIRRGHRLVLVGRPRQPIVVVHGNPPYSQFASAKMLNAPGCRCPGVSPPQSSRALSPPAVGPQGTCGNRLIRSCVRRIKDSGYKRTRFTQESRNSSWRGTIRSVPSLPSGT